jgi:hypothetical protein
VVGEVSTGWQAVELAESLQPDGLIMDINIPERRSNMAAGGPFGGTTGGNFGLAHGASASCGRSWSVMTNNGKSAQDAACLAVDLGWRLAQLYDSKELPGPPRGAKPKPLPVHLPGFGEMTPHEKACALAAHAGADLASLQAVLGTEMPTVEAVQTALSVVGHRRDEVRTAVHDLYLNARDRLAGSNPAAGVGFGLGRMLADTALLPASSKPEVLGERFEKYRLANAFDWLDDLDAVLPAHSASAVRASLRVWEKWVSDRRNADGTVDPAKVSQGTIRALRQQGDMWRRLLTGEKVADQLLDGRAYVGAAASLLANGRRLVFRYLWKWLWAILLAVAAVGASVWAALTYAPAGTDRVTVVLVSAASFLGVSWAGIRATLGRALRQAEHAMWEAEVVAAIGRAATITPKDKQDRPEPPESEPDDGSKPGPAVAGHASPGDAPIA